MLKELIKQLRHKLSEQEYYVGFATDYVPGQQNQKIHWLKTGPYRKGWFADPFLLSVGQDQIMVLAEEFLYKTRRGRLSLLTVDAHTYRLLKIDVILELSTHLSFPIYIVDNGKLYVYPENYESGGLNIYEYDIDKHILKNGRRIIDAPLLDTQIIKISGKYYAFGVEYDTGKQSDTRKLKIYVADTLFGDYKLHQVIDNARCEERGAGMIYEKDNALIRPTQDCEGDYGLAVILKLLNYDDNMTFSQEEICRILPEMSIKYGHGFHTYNTLSNVTVVDGRGYRRWLSRQLEPIVK